MPAPRSPEGSSYSRTWFETFAAPLDGDPRTDAEVDFLVRHLPVETHGRVLDVPCGRGRHAARLADRGYVVTAADADPAALHAARAALGGRGTALWADLRDLGPCGGPFDAVLNLWQSFGMYDDAGNAAVLAGMADRVRPGGRVVVDVYDFDRHVPTPGVRTRNYSQGSVEEVTGFERGRLRVRLRYSWSGDADAFEWRLYRRAEFQELAAAAGLAVISVGEDFNTPPTAVPGMPRAQYVLVKPGG